MLRAILAYFAILFLAFHTSPAHAQNLYSRFELGAQYSTIREDNNNFEEKNFSGFGARFAWNLNRRVAFESQVDFFPQDGVPLPNREIIAHGFFAPDALPAATGRATRARIAEVFGGAAVSEIW